METCIYCEQEVESQQQQLDGAHVRCYDKYMAWVDYHWTPTVREVVYA